MKTWIVPLVCICCLFLTQGVGLCQEKPIPPLSGASPAAEGTKLLEPGTVAPDFTLRDTEGTPFTLADDRGKRPVLLFFWSVFCEPCRHELPLIQKLHDKYGGPRLDVVAVSLDGEPLKSTVAGFVRQESYTFRVLIDELDSTESFKTAGAYGVARSPSLSLQEPAAFLVDRAGGAVFSRAGRLKEEELEKALQPLLKK